jgi:sterol 3beta-glucosyltransferase
LDFCIFKEKEEVLMEVAIIASGSRGDVQPYAALGKGLKAAGHAVHLWTSQEYQSLVLECGLDFINMGGVVEKVSPSQSTDLIDLMERGNVVKLLLSVLDFVQQMGCRSAESGLAACRGSDLILSGVGALFLGPAVSEKLGIPLIQTYVTPFTPTGAFSSPWIPSPDRKSVV